MVKFGLDQNSKDKSPEYVDLPTSTTNQGVFATRSSAHIFDRGDYDTIYLSRPLLKLSLALAGFFGALAVIMGAYGAHVLNHRPDVSDYHKQVFQTGNLYHFFHTLAILASPFARRPKLVAGWFFMGIVLFSGSCYTLAITGSSHAGLMAPYGGFCFLLGWLSLAF